MDVVLLGVFLLGCGSRTEPGDRTASPPQAEFLVGADQVLPAAIVGEPYAASVHVSGGDPPYAFALTGEGDFPGGLSLAPDGEVAGTPAQAGTFVFQVVAEDTAGRSKRMLVTLEVVLEPLVARCGETLSGTFTGSAFGLEGPDLTDLDDIAWLGVELPHDDTTRVELVFENTAVATLYVERPAELVGSWDIAAHYVGVYLNPAYTDMTVAIDAGTTPSLSGYDTQALLPLLLVGSSEGSWELKVVCTDGPIFVQLPQYPAELGTELDVDYEVYGDNAGVRISTEDPLPDWMVWDEATGKVTGTAVETGGWEFTIVAETEDGRRREERSILGVFDVTEVGCGDLVPIDVEEGYFDGEFYAYYDPRGFEVFRLPVDASISSFDLGLGGSDGYYLGLAFPEDEDFKFYGGAERLYVSPPDLALLTVDPRSYPAVGHYADAGLAYVSASTIGKDRSLTLQVTCSSAPRPELAGLPVLEPLVPVDRALPAVGGSPPLTWSARGLPAGLDLTPEGVLEGTTATAGTWEVELTVEDKLGLQATDTYTLYVGSDEACAGYAPIACDDVVPGTFTDVYTTDGSGPDSTTVFCFVDRGEWLGYEIDSEDATLRVDVADPGRTALEMFGEAAGTYVAYVDPGSSEGVTVDPWSWPDGDDYLDLPVLVALRAYAPGDWTAHLVCQ